jgi:PHD/YefM family antitoxin component YafN of YafNO toxin-antitoxin module
LVKRNKPAAVVVSAQDYAQLTARKGSRRVGMTAVQWLLSRPTTGKRSRKQLDEALQAERDHWE